MFEYGSRYATHRWRRTNFNANKNQFCLSNHRAILGIRKPSINNQHATCNINKKRQDSRGYDYLFILGGCRHLSYNMSNRTLSFLIAITTFWVFGGVTKVSAWTTIRQSSSQTPRSCFQPFATSLSLSSNDNNNDNTNPLDFLFNPYESKIPPEIKDDIYAAEANTAAAKDRNQRIALYAVIAFVGVTAAFFNGFLTELRSSTAPDGTPFTLETSSFAWVTSNPLFGFLFLNKIGGILTLLLGGGAGLLAEAEFDSRRINAEKIWEEMQRRRSAKLNSKTKGSNNAGASRKKKKRLSGKEAKRLNALSEVMMQEEEQEPGPDPADSLTETSNVEPVTETKEGLLDKVKGFYDKADKMAATQALLLNKQLEDQGIIEKITDESGFKVIGKEAAAKLQQEQEAKDKNSE